MATITNEELRALDVEELAVKLRECKEELFNLRFQVATGPNGKSRTSSMLFAKRLLVSTQLFVNENLESEVRREY